MLYTEWYLLVFDVIPLVVVEPPCYDNNIVILQPSFEVCYVRYDNCCYIMADVIAIGTLAT